MLFAYVASMLGRGAAPQTNVNDVTKRLFRTRAGQIIISAIFGAAIAALFQKTCKGKKCIVIEAPPLADLEKYVYRIGDKCYRYQPRVVSCTSAVTDEK
jgi:hypothetical protein